MFRSYLQGCDVWKLDLVVCRLHFLQCPQGLLAKHFEKLIQCDMRLNFLSQQPEIILDSPHFDTQPSAFEDPDNPKDRDLLQVSGKGSSTSCFQDSGSPQASLLSSFKTEHNDPPGMMLDSLPRDAPSPSSGTYIKDLVHVPFCFMYMLLVDCSHWLVSLNIWLWFTSSISPLYFNGIFSVGILTILLDIWSYFKVCPFHDLCGVFLA